MLKNSSEPQRLHAMQALRAYAAAMVISQHGTATYFYFSKVASLPSDTLQLPLGELGVKLFFCISGFIIFNSTKDLLPNFSSLIFFLRRRFFRVAPLYWLATSVLVLKHSMQGIATPGQDFLYSILFIPYISDQSLMRPILIQGWTLNYEIFFYSLFGVALLLQARRRLLFMSCALLTLVLLREYDYFSIQGNLLERSIYLLSGNYLLYFLIGIVIAALKVRLSSTRTKITISMRWSLTLSTTLLCVFILTEFYMRPSPLLSEIMMATTCSLCLIFCVIERNFIGRTGRLERMIELAGNASYSTYLFHGFFIVPLAKLIVLMNIKLSTLSLALLMVIVCTYTGILIYRYVEQPLLNKLR